MVSQMIIQSSNIHPLDRLLDTCALIFTSCARFIVYPEGSDTLLSEFGRVCERRKFGVNIGKSKVMRCSRLVMGTECM